MKFVGFLLVIFVTVQFVKCDDGEIFRWTVMEYLSPPRAPTYKIRDRDYYIAANNIPTGITPSTNRLFISIARKDYGIPSTLNYIDLRAARDQKSPMLRSYPNYEINELHNDLRPDTNRIISVYRTRIDECNRLWFVDTGVLETKDHITFIQDPSIWVIDLRTDKTLRRFELAIPLQEMAAGLQSITVDVDRTRCDEAFAYIPNSKSNKIIVYSYKDDEAWAFTDDTFKSNDQLATLKINDDEYYVNEGLYSIALGPRNLRNRTRIVYYHPLASFYEFFVSNRVLKSKELSKRDDHVLDFTYLGTRGDNTQSGIHDYDYRTRVLFTAQVQKSSISCWNVDKLLTPHNVATVAQNSDTLIYPADLKIDRTNIWFLSNQLPILEKTGMDIKKYHFFVFKRSIRTMIDGTICQASVSSTTPEPEATEEPEKSKKPSDKEQNNSTSTSIEIVSESDNANDDTITSEKSKSIIQSTSKIDKLKKTELPESKELPIILTSEINKDDTKESITSEQKMKLIVDILKNSETKKKIEKMTETREGDPIKLKTKVEFTEMKADQKGVNGKGVEEN
jgi:hypothetical protein